MSILALSAVSIHAPTWGATNPILIFCHFFIVSIHAPTWGATQHHHFHYGQGMFQSTHPRGVRLQVYLLVMLRLLFQSTHPRGVRLSAITCPKLSSLFQSTHPRGVRQYAYPATGLKNRFNPRTHVGCDRAPPSGRCTRCCFNPRTHVGCDVKRWSFSQAQEPFQSTHPRGVRRMTVADAAPITLVSIHAPTWGATAFLVANHQRG